MFILENWLCRDGCDDRDEEKDTGACCEGNLLAMIDEDLWLLLKLTGWGD